MEKWILRKAFEDYLPASVAWRQKEQFSDGVGYNWIDSLRALTSKEVSDDQLAMLNIAFLLILPCRRKNISTDAFLLNIFHQIPLHHAFHQFHP